MLIKSNQFSRKIQRFFIIYTWGMQVFGGSRRTVRSIKITNFQIFQISKYLNQVFYYYLVNDKDTTTNIKTILSRLQL